MEYPNRQHRPIEEYVGETARWISRLISELIMLTVLTGVCVVPFLLIEDKTKVTFWYCTGAYGVFLIGVAHLVGRRL